MSKKFYSGGEEIASKEYVDTEIGNIDLSAYEEVVNKTLSLSSSSTDTEYPSAKAVYDLFSSETGATVGDGLQTGSGSTPTNYCDLSRGAYFPSQRLTYFSIRKDANSQSISLGSTFILETLYITKAINEISDFTVDTRVGYLDILSTTHYQRHRYALTLKSDGTMYFTDVTNMYYGLYYLNATAQTINGQKIFNQIPCCGTAPTAYNHLANKQYVDNQIASAAGTPVYELPSTSSSNPFDFRTAALGTYVIKPSDVGQQFYYRQDDSSVQNITMQRIERVYITKHAADVSGTEPIGYYEYISGSNTGSENGKSYRNSIEYNSTTDSVSMGSTPSNDGQLVTMLAQTFTGRKTFGVAPVVSSYSAPTQNNELVMKKYVDDNAFNPVTVPVSLLSIEPGMTSAQIIACLGGQSNIDKLFDALDNGKPIFGTALNPLTGEYVQVPILITTSDTSGGSRTIFFNAIVQGSSWEMLLSYNSNLSTWTAQSVTRTPLLKSTSVAPLYDETSTYAVGDYCIYDGDGKLYKCTTAITVAEPFTIGHWTETTIMGEFGNISTVLAGLTTPNNGGGN